MVNIKFVEIDNFFNDILSQEKIRKYLHLYSLFISIFIVFIFFLIFLSASISSAQNQETRTKINQKPIANLSTLSSKVVSIGTEISLSAAGSVDPESQPLSYYWSFSKKPNHSKAYFTTPSPTRPSFQADVLGFYVVTLIVYDGIFFSEPKSLVISASHADGEITLTSEDYRTPQLCSLFGGIFGCTEVSKNFTATPGKHILKITNNSATSVSLRLNSTPLSLPHEFIRSSKTFLVTIILLDNNNLTIKVIGGTGSSVNIEVVKPGRIIDNNSVPSVSDLSLSTEINSRNASGFLSILDADVGQSHSSEILNITNNHNNTLLSKGISYLISNQFNYTSPQGFKGLDNFYILSSDDGFHQKELFQK